MHNFLNRIPKGSGKKLMGLFVVAMMLTIVLMPNTGIGTVKGEYIDYTENYLSYMSKVELYNTADEKLGSWVRYVNPNEVLRIDSGEVVDYVIITIIIEKTELSDPNSPYTEQDLDIWWYTDIENVHYTYDYTFVEGISLDSDTVMGKYKLECTGWTIAQDTEYFFGAKYRIHVP